MSTLSKALYEALILFQIFIAAVGSLTISQTFIFYPYGGNVLIMLYLTIRPLLSMIVLFVTLTQLRLKSAATKKQTLIIEWTKSGIVTAVWIWLLVMVVLGAVAGSGRQGPVFPGLLVHQVLSLVVGLLLNCAVFYSTLYIGYRRTNDGSIRLGEESGSLLPQ